MSPKTYSRILQAGVYLSLFTVFLVFKNLLFPYITSKQITFNIIMEILFVFWVAFIVKYPSYRPKKSWISFGLIGFFIALILSSIFGVDFNLSFWGDIERMLGVFHLLHFLAFYFIIITVFREWKDWRPLFILSIILAVGVSIYGLKNNQYSTIGNTAYVSGYLIFNIFFCLLLFFRSNQGWWRWLYFLPLPIYYFQFRLANTSGAHVGLVAGLLTMLFLYGLLHKNRRAKITTFSTLLILTALIALVWVNRQSDFVTNNKYLRVANSISFQKVTFQTRLISWRGALKDFKNHPVFGTGHGNYAIIFDKYFTPNFYDYTRAETYFDRAHNNVIDIASTSGLVGLLTYLSIFGFTGFYLISGYRKEKIDLHNFAIVAGLFVAYFVQNLAVFDSLVTYVGCFMTLGYVYWLYHKDDAELERESIALSNREIYALAITGLVMLVVMWQYNIKVYKMLDLTIAGQMAWSQRGAEETMAVYKQALAYNTPLDRDSRTSFNRLFASSPAVLKNVDPKKAREIMDYNLELAEANVKYNPGDSLNQMMLAQLLDVTSYYYRDDTEKFAYYSDRALEAIDKSIAASPGRVPIYYQKAQIYMTRGEKDKVIETLKYAYSLNEKYYDSACHLASTMLYYKNDAEALKYYDQCIDLGGLEFLAPSSLVLGLINHYEELKDVKRLQKLYLRLTQLEPKEINYWVQYAKFSAEIGDKATAITAAQKVAEISPGMKSYVDEFIKKLQ